MSSSSRLFPELPPTFDVEDDTVTFVSSSPVSDANDTDSYVEEVFELLKENAVEPEDISEIEDLHVFVRRHPKSKQAKVTKERVLVYAGGLGLLPQLPGYDMKGEDFWDYRAPMQREDHEQYDLVSLTGDFTKDSCPCYVCGGRCLRRLHGRNAERKAGDREKGYLSWERAYVMPFTLGKNANAYNLRIICSKCNRERGDLLPYTYALSSLPLGVRTLASEECINSYMRLLRNHFDE